MERGTGRPPEVHGPVVDDETRCVHYSTPVDVVAMKFGCCERYYPCYQCHAEDAGHEPRVWPAERFDEPAVLCGVCRSELTVHEYLATPACPRCGAEFNPRCAAHRHLYFET